MSIENLGGFIKTMKSLVDHPEVEKLTEMEGGIPVISSSSRTFINNADDALSDAVSELEVSAGCFLFDDNGLLKSNVVKELKKHAIELVRLGQEHQPFSHAMQTSKFSILVSN